MNCFTSRGAGLMLGCLLASAAAAADLQLSGNFGYTTQNNNSTAVITVERIENRTNGGNSGTIRLELWATASRYGGGGISGYRLASHSLGQLGGGRAYTGISSGTVPFSMPPDGSNDNWSQGPNVAAMSQAFTRLGAFALPSASRDAAVLDNFAPGLWSMQVSGPASGGVALVEVYDADANPGSAARLVNVSARTQVGAGERALFAGFVVAGGSRRVLIRGVGPSLRTFNVSGALSDPVLRLFSGDRVIGENDDLMSSPDRAAIEAAARTVGAFGFTSGLDSALLVTLAPGAYSAQVSGLDGGTGIGLVEIYEAP